MNPRPHHQTRRRVLGLFAASSVAGLMAATRFNAPASAPHILRWQGQALGAKANLHIHHEDPSEAQRLQALALAELERLEAIFSLYRPDSAVARLNRDGALDAPPVELVALLNRAKHFSRATRGAFDVTIQPLWALYQAHFSGLDPDPGGPSQAAIETARGQIGSDRLDVTSKRISFQNPGMAITLNGIAQGEITDRVAELLASQGLEHSLIDLGEMRAIGAHPTGRAWRVGLKDAFDARNITGQVGLNNRALATSAVTGTVFDIAGRQHHILDPNTDAPGRGLISASVVARSAATADALTTAMLATKRPISNQILAREGAEQIFTTDQTGETHRRVLV
jgi:FAD:protein FMN transferase